MVIFTLKQIVDRTYFYNFTGIDNCDSITGLSDDSEVSNEYNGSIQFLLKAVHHFKHLRLYRDIKCSGRLISQKKHRLTGESDCDHDPLLHSS